MSMYTEIKEKVTNGDYTYLEYYDLMVGERRIDIKTEDDDMILFYAFTPYGKFKRMSYYFGSLESTMELMCRNNIRTGQFSSISYQTGTNKAKINF